MTERIDSIRAKLRTALYIGAAVIAFVLFLSCFTGRGQRFWQALLHDAGLGPFTEEIPHDGLNIHVIDVGKSDAILVECGDTALLVDTGTQGDSEKIERYIKSRDISVLDALLLSHGDSDHAGGAKKLLQSIPTQEIVCSPFTSVNESFPDITCVQVGDILIYGDLLVEILGPDRAFETENDCSLVFRLWYGPFSMLFCGDMEAAAESALLESGQDIYANVLKVAHHGSDTSTSIAFLEAVQPQYAVISSGEDRSLLPRNKVLKRLHDAGAEIYRTDKHGTVVFSVSGENIKIKTERDSYEENDH